MGKKNTSILVAISVLTILIVGLLVANSVRRSSHIHLPEEEVLQGAQSAVDGSAVNSISVNPATVQRVIATLRRPDSYSRSITVEQIWSGGSGVSNATVNVRDGWTRIDTQQGSGMTRHCLTDGERTYIWYGNETTWYEGSAVGFSADDEQMIPTYEDVLALPMEEIVAADYRSFSGSDCIYVEAGESVKLCYWVSVTTGLLTAAEKYEGETLVYRMIASENGGEVSEELLVLPDGTALY